MTNHAHERWLPVVGWEGWYEVSDLGRIRSLDRDVLIQMPYGPAVRHYRGKILAATVGNRGYPEVKLYRPGHRSGRPVHMLVLEAFTGPCPPGQEARHGPAGKLVASLANLCRGSRSENQLDRVRDGNSNRGERHGLAVLTREIVLDLRNRTEAGERQIDLAAEYRLTRANVWAVVHRKSWDWLE